MTMRESTEKKRLAVDWSDGIPVDLLTLIAQNIDSIANYIAFAAVCRSWYNVIALNRITESTPWLMLSPKQDSTSRSFYRFGSSNQVLNIEFPPESKGRRCWGSPFGWIITYDSDIDDMNLYNPLSRASIPLPKLFPYFAKKYSGNGSVEFHDCPRLVEKAILKASPDSPHCMVIVMPIVQGFDDDVLCAKPMDNMWSVIRRANLEDVVSFQGNLYGCNWGTGNIVTFVSDQTDFSNHLILKRFADIPPRMIHRAEEVAREYFRRKHFVDLGGELHLVILYVEPAWLKLSNIVDHSSTHDVEIYKIDLSTKVWKPVKCLGDHCLIIGTNNAFAVSVSGNGMSLRPNCVYFLDDEAFCKQSDRTSDIGVLERHFGAKPLGENAGPLFDVSNSPQPFMFKALPSVLYSHSCWITPYLQFHEPIEGQATEYHKS